MPGAPRALREQGRRSFGVLLLAFLAGCLKCESEIAHVPSLSTIFLFAISLSVVMPGHSRPKDGVATLAYDPGIHDEAQRASALQANPPLMHRVMDCRVKPGNDER